MKVLKKRTFVEKCLSYVLRPAPTYVSACLRIGITFIAIAQAIAILPYLDALLGPYGIVQYPVNQLFTTPHLPNIHSLSSGIVTMTGCMPEVALRGIMVGYIMLMFLLLVGCWTTPVKWLCWFAHLAIKCTDGAGSYGVSEFLNILFFYLALSPCGEVWSVDAKHRLRKRRYSWETGVLLFVLKLHLCAVYVSTGIEKAVGPEWWNGESVWRALRSEHALIDFSWLAAVPWLAAAMGWAVLLVEIGYAVGVFFKRTRVYWVLTIIGFHLSIAVLLGLWLFSATMIVFNVCAWLPELRVFYQQTVLGVRKRLSGSRL